MFKKKFKFYSVVDTFENNELITILEKKEQLNEFIGKYLYLLNAEHFKSWCYYRNTPINSNSWQQYLINITPQHVNRFKIEEFYLTKSEVASLLRVSSGIVPINCSYESENEKKLLAQLLYKQVNKTEETKDGEQR